MTLDPLISQLVGDLKPRRSMTLRQLAIYSMCCFAGVLILLMAVLGIRPDYHTAMQTGAMFWKPSLFALCGFSAILCVFAVSLPGRTIKRIYLLPALIAALFLIGLIFQVFAHFDINDMIAALTDRRAPYCLGIVTIFASIIFAILWRVWLAKSAPMNVVLAGALAGASSGFIAASAYAFHCGQDHPFYLITYYGLPILLLSAVGAWCGKRYLEW